MSKKTLAAKIKKHTTHIHYGQALISKLLVTLLIKYQYDKNITPQNHQERSLLIKSNFNSNFFVSSKLSRCVLCEVYSFVDETSFSPIVKNFP